MEAGRQCIFVERCVIFNFLFLNQYYTLLGFSWTEIPRGFGQKVSYFQYDMIKSVQTETTYIKPNRHSQRLLPDDNFVEALKNI